MASSSSTLSAADVSRLTDIISADNRLRFTVEYLGISHTELKTIESEAHFNHHDTLYECVTRWKNKIEAQGKDAKDELVKILTQIRKEHGWFSFNDMAFLTDVTGMQIPESSK